MTLEEFKKIANGTNQWGDPVCAWQIRSGRYCDVAYEVKEVSYPRYSIRLHCREDEFSKYQDTMGLLGELLLDKFDVPVAEKWVRELEAKLAS